MYMCGGNLQRKHQEVQNLRTELFDLKIELVSLKKQRGAADNIEKATRRGAVEILKKPRGAAFEKLDLKTLLRIPKKKQKILQLVRMEKIGSL